jgi:hypothetical protein
VVLTERVGGGASGIGFDWIGLILLEWIGLAWIDWINGIELD